MRFYFRENDDGTTAVICAHCYQTVGTTRTARVHALMDEHRCEEWDAAQRRGPQIPRARSAQMHTAVTVALLLYVLPTMIEWTWSKVGGLSLAVVLIGDLAGCAYIGHVCGRWKLAASLYAAATIVEYWMLTTHSASLQTLVWAMDVIPSMVVFSLVQRQMRYGESR